MADPWYLKHFSKDAAEATYVLRHSSDSIIVLRAFGTVAREVDRVTVECVNDCRADGATWAEIGEALDITRQAAQARFSNLPPDIP